MRLIHATTVQKLASIQKRGLLPSKAVRKRRAVWLASESVEEWAIKHCLINQGVRMDEVVVITVDIPAEWAKGFKGDLWYCNRVIPPTLFRSVKRFVAVVEELS